MKTIREVLGKGKRSFYARVSSDKQTIDMQRHHVYKFIENYECEIVQEYIDPGESAFKKKITQRPQMMKLIEGVEQGSTILLLYMRTIVLHVQNWNTCKYD